MKVHAARAARAGRSASISPAPKQSWMARLGRTQRLGLGQANAHLRRPHDGSKSSRRTGFGREPPMHTGDKRHDPMMGETRQVAQERRRRRGVTHEAL